MTGECARHRHVAQGKAREQLGGILTFFFSKFEYCHEQSPPSDGHFVFDKINKRVDSWTLNWPKKKNEQNFNENKKKMFWCAGPERGRRLSGRWNHRLNLAHQPAASFASLSLSLSLLLLHPTLWLDFLEWFGRRVHLPRLCSLWMRWPYKSRHQPLSSSLQTDNYFLKNTKTSR